MANRRQRRDARGYAMMQMDPALMNRRDRKGAERYAATMAAQQRATPVAPAGIGQVVLEDAGAMPGITAPVLAETAPNYAYYNGNQGNYTIQAGDTLGAIAKRNNTTVAALQEANGILDPNKIRGGARLIIPGGAAGTRPGANPAGTPANQVDIVDINTMPGRNYTPGFAGNGARIIDSAVDGASQLVQMAANWPNTALQLAGRGNAGVLDIIAGGVGGAGNAARQRVQDFVDQRDPNNPITQGAQVIVDGVANAGRGVVNGIRSVSDVFDGVADWAKGRKHENARVFQNFRDNNNGYVQIADYVDQAIDPAGIYRGVPMQRRGGIIPQNNTEDWVSRDRFSRYRPY